MKKLVIVSILLVNTLLGQSQNVGIGTNSPTRARLQVHGAVGSTTALFGAETTGISLQSNFPTVGFNEYYNNGHRYIANGFAAQQFLDPAGGYMAIDLFLNGNANAVATGQRRLLSLSYSGDVIIGTGAGRISINQTPDLESRYNATLQVKQSPSGGNRGICLIDVTSGAAWRLSSHYSPGVSGYLLLNYNGTDVGSFDGFDGKYFNYSDSRLKEDIQELPSLLDKVLQLHPVHYKWKAKKDTDRRSTGFIAQEVQSLFPDQVMMIPQKNNGGDQPADLHAISYSDFGVIAIKAIQEQHEIILALKQRIELLEKEMLKLNHK